MKIDRTENRSSAEIEHDPSGVTVPHHEELALIQALRDKGYDLEVYTVGKHNRVSGPVGQQVLWYTNPAPYVKDVSEIGARVIDSNTSTNEATHSGIVRLHAKAIRSTQEACAKCHDGAKVGDKVGAVVYRYWSRKDGKFSLLDLMHEANAKESPKKTPHGLH